MTAARKTAPALAPLSREVFYPESDGEPMADNTKQLRWIVTLYGNLAALFRDDPNVFVGGNQFWYPVEGEPEVRAAPDAYVVFGRPKGDRPSYKQWEEGGVPLTVVFEVLSPANCYSEMMDKFSFYEEHGVEEYYVYDPDRNRLHGYARRGDVLVRVRKIDGFASPRLGIRFDLAGTELVVRYPDGRPFRSFEEVEAARFAAEQRAGEAERRAAQERQQRLEAERRSTRLIELGRKARRQQATAEELAELERLEEQGPSA
jgi:Uma2 family endonuclease